MKRHLAVALALVLFFGRAAHAHRLDEYLQATILSIEKDRMQASMRLIPGVAVASSIIAAIDRDGDGIFSPSEQTAYAQRVLADLTITIDGHPLEPRLLSVTYPGKAVLKEGLGEIHLDFTVPLPPGGRNRSLHLENHHLTQGSAYLVNALVPSEPGLQIVAQKRNELQTAYELDFVQAGVPLPSPDRAWWRAAAIAGALFFLGVLCLRLTPLVHKIQRPTSPLRS